MKDIVLITAYCDTKEKQQVLTNLVKQFSKHRKKFDIMIISHLPIPTHVCEEVNYVFYDQKNELLYDWDMRSTPWFDPNNERPILSCFTGNFNTHLAIWRMIILGNVIAKNLGYIKCHHLEYDCDIKDFSQFYDNSELLDNVDAVTYTKIVDTVDPILFGTYQCYRLDRLHQDLLTLNENKIKNEIRESVDKSPERMLYDLLNHQKNVITKNKRQLEEYGNNFGLSHSKVSDGNTAWCLPYYDKLNGMLGFVIWNMEEGRGEIEVQVIYNDERVIDFGKVQPQHWRLIEIDPFENATKMVVMLNNKIRNIFDFTKDGELFKRVSYRQEFRR